MQSVNEETTYDFDYVVCEADLSRLRSVVEQLESRHSIEILRPPSPCLTMLRAEDSLESQQFFLGEALTTECEVQVDSATIGYGVCLGDEPQRCYCIAVLNAFEDAGDATIDAFVAHERQSIVEREQLESALIQRTDVDFKLMEEV